MILNLGISENWVSPTTISSYTNQFTDRIQVDINWAAANFPAIMRVDYVRIYQQEGHESITCDPPGFETTEYIKNHPEAYQNPNYTVSRRRILETRKEVDLY
jgi:hypothetical protein